MIRRNRVPLLELPGLSVVPSGGSRADSFHDAPNDRVRQDPSEQQGANTRSGANRRRRRANKRDHTGPSDACPPAPRRNRASAGRRNCGPAGHRYVAGVDEVGRGAWAGPLTVGVVVLGRAPRPAPPSGLRDSKQLVEEVRERLFDPLARWCASWAVGHAGPEECDAVGMTAALRLATRRAFGQLPPDFLPDAVVLDGNFDYVTPEPAPFLFDADDARCPASPPPSRRSSRLTPSAHQWRPLPSWPR